MGAGRLVNILLLLQARAKVTARELAAELEVSERTIYRDIDELSGAGVPVYAIRGPDGGFALIDGPTIEVPPIPVRSQRGRITRIRIRISPAALQIGLLTGRLPGLRRRHQDLAPDDRPDWLTATFRADSLDAAVADLLALGSEVEVLRPAELRRRLAATTEAMAAHYRGDP